MSVVNTDRPSTVFQYTFDRLNEQANKDRLGIRDVFYGDQENIPHVPAVAVEPAPFTRTLSGIGGKGRTDNNIQMVLMLYWSKFGKPGDVQQSRQDVDVFAETIMDFLHEDMRMGGLVVHGFVTNIEPGYALRERSLMRTARVTWEGMTKTLIL